MKARPWDGSHPSNWIRHTPEGRIQELETKVEALEAFIRKRFGDDALTLERDANRNAPLKKRGPARTVPEDHLFYRREHIIDFFELFWPELRVAFLKKSPTTIRRLLGHYSSVSGPSAPTAATILRNVDQLLEFLNSKDWNGDPRIAAGAMAGVPDIRWTTSLRHSRAMPTGKAVGTRALRDYLCRNFPSVFRRLLCARSPEEIHEIMSKVRTADREYNWLRDNPEEVATILRQGERHDRL